VEVVQVFLIQVLQLVRDFLLDLIDLFNRVQPQALRFLLFQASTALLVADVNDHGHDLVEALYACVLDLRIVEGDVRVDVHGRDHLLFAEAREHLDVQRYGLPVLALPLVENSARIYHALVLTYLQAILDWEVFALHILHSILPILLLAYDPRQLDDQVFELILLRMASIVPSSDLYKSTVLILFHYGRLLDFEHGVDEVEAEVAGLGLGWSVLVDGLYYLVVVAFKPLVAEFDGALSIHFNKRANILQDQLLHLLRYVLIVVVCQDVGLDVLEPYEDILFDDFDLEEHLQALLVVLQELVQVHADHVHGTAVRLGTECLDGFLVNLLFN